MLGFWLNHYKKQNPFLLEWVFWFLYFFVNFAKTFLNHFPHNYGDSQ